MIFNYLGQYLTTPNVVYKPVKSRTSWLLSYNRVIGYENFIINDYQFQLCRIFGGITSLQFTWFPMMKISIVYLVIIDAIWVTVTFIMK